MSIISTFIVPHPPLIIPKIGRGQEMKIEKTIKSYDNIAKKIAEIQPETIVIISPHSVMYSDYIHISPGKKASGNFREFGETEIKLEVNYDEEFANKLAQLSEEEEIHAGTLGEKNKSLDHGTMVPLFFVDKYYKDYNIVRISISRLSFIEHYNFGKCISKIADELNKKVIVIASGDLSHMLREEGPYGFTEEGPIFDRETTEALSRGDFMRLLTFDEDFCEIAAECGLRSFIIMAGALDGKSVKSKLLSYEGPYGVGYSVASFDVIGIDDNRHFDKIYNKIEEERLNLIIEKEDEYVRLARNSLESYINDKKIIEKTDKLPNEMLTNKSGVFVSLKLNGQLRGCIGTISPTTNSVADEIIQNAISSGLEDPRFNPVNKNELRKLEYSVDVLGVAEAIESINELDVKKYGVIVTKGKKKGLLLPNLEGVNSVEEQVSISLKKAGISSNESYQLERFEVVRHK
ncbi:AmmeMemoRadiSam system protein A/AmmeMemoRadiSam system protein B [Sedimentibacter acidaminivorans]|uniref:AmmeMemoRadiSam system protein A/AmmeMemoRadiSam system protein B n=1 Tax=Sedimentibacter acidaminivorans TaxID=913099 RepID=A0ABS4GCH4_9FIRM|nr:AmmeMemoRadiSam system protein A [Sedimentibacter acidaminivorans]MBP1925359.1 AmmeMemoRadiSam system protein A/AmmeMemoRadiSam system protein B [Sedimentibacter acidaminivorans]